jgi:type I restriction enzyme S subunit
MTNWQTKKLGDLTQKIGSGVTPRGGSDVFVDDGVFFIRSQNIRNNKVDMTDRKYIPKSIDEKMRSSRVQKNDILYNITGASIGRSAVYKSSLDANVNQHVCIVRIKEGSPKFVQYALSSEVGARNLWGFQAGGNREGLNFQQLASFKINIPEKPEQERIVGVLEVWDEYIEKLEQKIALKEQLKKGLMQQLLTGKRRLPEFGDDWKGVRLGDIAKMQSGGTPSSKNDKFYGDDVIWVSIADMTSSGKYLSDSQRKLSKLGYDSSTARIYPANTVLYAMYASIGECVIASVTLSSSQAILGIQPSEKLDYEYLYYYLTSKKDEVKLLGQQGTQSNLNAGIVKDFKLKLPSTEEQKKIATILSKSDEETELLKKQINIIKSQKKYLLKNLITGTIRTPEDLQPLDTSRLERSAL